ncbi:MAG: hypothetical protein RRZ69_04100 [Clostridia bacterium]
MDVSEWKVAKKSHQVWALSRESVSCKGIMQRTGIFCRGRCPHRPAGGSPSGLAKS